MIAAQEPPAAYPPGMQQSFFHSFGAHSADQQDQVLRWMHAQNMARFNNMQYQQSSWTPEPTPPILTQYPTPSHVAGQQMVPHCQQTMGASQHQGYAQGSQGGFFFQGGGFQGGGFQGGGFQGGGCQGCGCQGGGSFPSFQQQGSCPMPGMPSGMPPGYGSMPGSYPPGPSNYQGH